MIFAKPNDELNQIGYFTAPTLAELQDKVNAEITEFVKQNDGNYRYSVDVFPDWKFVNGEYVQMLHFTCWKMLFRPRRKPAPKKKAAVKVN